MDDIDLTILSLLQENARTPNAALARQVGMAPSAVLERVRKLEERGVIEGYAARLRPTALGLGLTAFIMVRTDDRAGESRTAEQLAALPEVQEVHHVAGEDCYLIKVRVADPGTLAQLMREGLGSITTVTSTRTTIVLETVKETAALPLPDATRSRP